MKKKSLEQLQHLNILKCLKNPNFNDELPKLIKEIEQSSWIYKERIRLTETREYKVNKTK